MNEKDLLLRFIFENASVRGELVQLDTSFQTIMDQHAYPPIIRKLLGEALVAACLLNAILKTKGRLTVQFQGKGKLKLLLAQCNHQFHLRGLAQWDGELQEQDLARYIKQGTLMISIDPENGQQRYQGVVDWQGETLAKSIENYFRDSEQIATRLWLAVSQTTAAGLLLQVLPKEVKEPDHNWEHIIHLTETITSEELLHLNPQNILHRLYSQEKVGVFDPVAIEFRCTCSAERGENAILLLGKEEVEEELREKQKIVVTCEFCGKEFHFDRVDVVNIFSKGDQSSSGSRLH